VSEDALLALIDGTLDEAAERRVLDTMASRPDLMASVRAMRRDRALLSELCDLEAPPGVTEAVEAAVERAMLLESPSAFADLPPAPIAIRRAHVPTSPRHHYALAAAAALALLAGGVGFWTLKGGGSGGSGGPAGTRIALNAPERQDSASEFKDQLSLAGAPPGAADARAQSEAAPAAAKAAVSDAAPSVPIPVVAVNDAPAIDTAAPEPVPAARVVSLERAVDLAAQGRLAVRVRPRSMSEAIGGMDAIASRDTGRAWRLSSPIPPGHEGAGSGLSELARHDAARAEHEARQRAVASESSIGALRLSEALADRAPARESHPYFASLALTPESLAALRGAIEDQTDASVTFEELSGPAQPEVDIRDVEPLWWDDQPGRWVPWADVLVVVEG